MIQAIRENFIITIAIAYQPIMKLLIKRYAFNAIIAALARPALEQQILNAQHAILQN